MDIIINEFSESDIEGLIGFLTGERWSFHSTPQITRERVSEQLKNGYFTGEGIKTFLITGGDNITIGYMRLFDLGEENDASETPLFDIRITASMRGKGIGRKAVKWLVDYVFTNYPAKTRFEATTRADNTAMRRVFDQCGFVKEAHYRSAWPDELGNKYDCTGYAVLKEDWKNGTNTPVNFCD